MTAHECDGGVFDRNLCASPCDAMHFYCGVCGRRMDHCLFDPVSWSGLFGSAPGMTAEQFGIAIDRDPEDYRFALVRDAVGDIEENE